MKLTSVGDKDHLGKLPNKQGLGNTLKQSVKDTNDDYQVASQGRNRLDFSEQRKASIVSQGRSQAMGS